MKKGFTLLETMIVLAIIGMIAAIAIPSYVEAKNKAEAQRKAAPQTVLDKRPTFEPAVEAQPIQPSGVAESVMINGVEYFRKVAPDTITLDGVEYKRVR